jgi:hypothetical protein
LRDAPLRVVAARVADEEIVGHCFLSVQVPARRKSE